MNAPMLSQLLLTYALSIVLVNVAQIAFGSDFKTVPNQVFTGSFSVGGLIISYSKLVPFIYLYSYCGYSVLHFEQDTVRKSH